MKTYIACCLVNNKYSENFVQAANQQNAEALARKLFEGVKMVVEAEPEDLVN